MAALLGFITHSNLPPYVAFLAIVAYLIADKWYPRFTKAEGDERRQLSRDQQTVREWMAKRLDLTTARLEAAEKRADASEADNRAIRMRLDDCQEQHRETQDAMVIVEQRLDECTKAHEATLAVVTERVGTMLDALRKAGVDFLVDTTTMPPIPSSVQELLAGVPKTVAFHRAAPTPTTKRPKS